MPGTIANFKTTLHLNDQPIEILTTVTQGMCDVKYELSSPREMDPATVAVALYLMCHDICKRLEMNIDDLVEGLIDSDETTH
jgi:hypothetical protein